VRIMILVICDIYDMATVVSFLAYAVFSAQTHGSARGVRPVRGRGSVRGAGAHEQGVRHGHGGHGRAHLQNSEAAAETDLLSGGCERTHMFTALPRCWWVLLCLMYYVLCIMCSTCMILYCELFIVDLLTGFCSVSLSLCVPLSVSHDHDWYSSRETKRNPSWRSTSSWP
jgi:hypothetical protein